MERLPVELLCWFVLCDQKRIPALRDALGTTETLVAALNGSDVCLEDSPLLTDLLDLLLSSAAGKKGKDSREKERLLD